MESDSRGGGAQALRQRGPPMSVMWSVVMCVCGGWVGECCDHPINKRPRRCRAGRRGGQEPRAPHPPGILKGGAGHGRPWGQQASGPSKKLEREGGHTSRRPFAAANAGAGADRCGADGCCVQVPRGPPRRALTLAGCLARGVGALAGVRGWLLGRLARTGAERGAVAVLVGRPRLLRGEGHLQLYWLPGVGQGRRGRG